MPNEMDREMHEKQTHCGTCAKPFTAAKYECEICGEWQCSDECRQKHIKIMDGTYGTHDPDMPSELQEEAELVTNWGKS